MDTSTAAESHTSSVSSAVVPTGGSAHPAIGSGPHSLGSDSAEYYTWDALPVNDRTFARKLATELGCPHISVFCLGYVTREHAREEAVSVRLEAIPSGSEPSEAEAAALSAIITAMKTGSWKARMQAMYAVQVAAKGNPSVFATSMSALAPALRDCCACLRSGVAKNGHLTVTYLARGCGFYFSRDVISCLFSTLLAKAANEKRFLADSAVIACKALCSKTYRTLQDQSWSCIISEYKAKSKNTMIVGRVSEVLNHAIEQFVTAPPRTQDVARLGRTISTADTLGEGQSACLSLTAEAGTVGTTNMPTPQLTVETIQMLLPTLASLITERLPGTKADARQSLGWLQYYWNENLKENRGGFHEMIHSNMKLFANESQRAAVFKCLSELHVNHFAATGQDGNANSSSSAAAKSRVGRTATKDGQLARRSSRTQSLNARGPEEPSRQQGRVGATVNSVMRRPVMVGVGHLPPIRRVACGLPSSPEILLSTHQRRELTSLAVPSHPEHGLAKRYSPRPNGDGPAGSDEDAGSVQQENKGNPCGSPANASSAPSADTAGPYPQKQLLHQQPSRFGSSHGRRSLEALQTSPEGRKSDHRVAKHHCDAEEEPLCRPQQHGDSCAIGFPNSENRNPNNDSDCAGVFHTNDQRPQGPNPALQLPKGLPVTIEDPKFSAACCVSPLSCPAHLVVRNENREPSRLLSSEVRNVASNGAAACKPMSGPLCSTSSTTVPSSTVELSSCKTIEISKLPTTTNVEPLPTFKHRNQLDQSGQNRYSAASCGESFYEESAPARGLLGRALPRSATSGIAAGVPYTIPDIATHGRHRQTRSFDSANGKLPTTSNSDLKSHPATSSINRSSSSSCSTRVIPVPDSRSEGLSRRRYGSATRHVRAGGRHPAGGAVPSLPPLPAGQRGRSSWRQPSKGPSPPDVVAGGSPSAWSTCSLPVSARSRKAPGGRSQPSDGRLAAAKPPTAKHSPSGTATAGFECRYSSSQHRVVSSSGRRPAGLSQCSPEGGRLSPATSIKTFPSLAREPNPIAKGAADHSFSYRTGLVYQKRRGLPAGQRDGSVGRSPTRTSSQPPGSRLSCRGGAARVPVHHGPKSNLKSWRI